MVTEKIRPIVKKNIEGNPVYKFLGRIGVGPDFFSWLAIVWAVFGAFFILENRLWWALPFVVLAMMWDGIDGAYARTLHRTTRFGAYIEGMIDLYVEVIVMLAVIVWQYPIEGALVMILSMMLSYAKPRLAQVIPAKDVDWPGIGEKFQRRLFFLIAMFVHLVFPSFEIAGKIMDTFSVMMYLLALMVFIGGIQRIMYAKKMIKEYEKGMK